MSNKRDTDIAHIKIKIANCRTALELSSYGKEQKFALRTITIPDLKRKLFALENPPEDSPAETAL